MRFLACDFETTIFNKGNFADKRNWAVSYVVSGTNIPTTFKYYSDPDFISFIKKLICEVDIFVAFQAKFDIHWLRNIGIVIPDNVKIWDLQLAEFIYSGQSLPLDSLDAACERYGLPRKPDLVKEYWNQGISTEHIPVNILREYNIHDVESNVQIFQLQQQLFDDKLKQLVYLEGEDLKTLQAAEYAGIKFDIEKANEVITTQTAKVSEIEQELCKYLPSECDKSWFNFDSGDHLSALLYGGEITFDYAIPEEAVYKSGPKKGETYTRNRWHEAKVLFLQIFKPIDGTEVAKTKLLPPWATHFYQTDASTLGQLKAKTQQQKQILLDLAKRSAIAKVSEMAASLTKKVIDMNWGEYLHGQYNQNIVVTGRLSSSSPNLQNTPPEIDSLLVSRYD